MSQNELQRLLPRHHEIIKMCLCGITRNDIASTLKMSPEGVGLIINSPLFQDELARQREMQIRKDSEVRSNDALDILQNAAADAAQKHVNLLDSDDERVVQASANAILDRVLKGNDAGKGLVKLDQGVVNMLQITINEIKIHNIPSNAPDIERTDIEIN